MHATRTSWIWSTLLLASCAVATSDDGSPVESESNALRLPGTPIAFSTFVDPQGVAPSGEASMLITRPAQYARVVGHAAPADSDFRREAVVLYAAGVQPTGGYTASVLDVHLFAGFLTVTTQLQTPGDNCIETESLTHPYALIRFARPFVLLGARFIHRTRVHDCPAAPTCDDFPCDAGQHCELHQVECFTTPCYPEPTCVQDQPKHFCGGIAGIPCPGAGQCVDDPSDGCDPKQGGADCGGMCVCEAGPCDNGALFDASPDVCACATDPCAGVRCQKGERCEHSGSEGICVSDGTLTCGPNICPDGQTCCNASCGVCTPLGFACTDIACQATP